MSRLEEIIKLLAADPKDDFLRYGYALELKSAGDLNKALELFKALLADNPDYLPAYYTSAMVALDLNDKETAESILKKGLEIARKQNKKHTMAEINSALDTLNDID